MVLLVVSAGAWMATTGSAAAAGPCDAIVQRSNEITQAQLAFTTQAYSDGKITPEEAAQTEEFSNAISRVTADLAQCIETGVVPPGYQPAKPPPDTQPPDVPNTFKVEIGHWRIGDRELKIEWDTAEPELAPKVSFYKITSGVQSSACRKPRKGQSSHGRRSCQVRTAVGSLTAPVGATSLNFNGKVGGHRLKPGSYLLSLTLTDAAGNSSKPKTTRLKILPPKH
jgi:hypothetical protein